jgi:hypothetical protein
MFAFCLTSICNLLYIRTNSEMEGMFAYLRLHKESQSNLRKVIKAELSEICKDLKMKQKQINDASDWLIYKSKRFN